jgi:hypothetical protein
MNTMKRIAKALVIATLASTAVAATAADVPYPSSGRDGYNQSSVFPNMQTFEQQHRDSVLSQAPTPYPSAAQQEYPLSGEFANIVTYKQEHRNDPVARSNSSAFPENLSPEPSMADEGLVPGIAGIAPYVAPAPYAVGGTR